MPGSIVPVNFLLVGRNRCGTELWVRPLLLNVLLLNDSLGFLAFALSGCSCHGLVTATHRATATNAACVVASVATARAARRPTTRMINM